MQNYENTIYDYIKNNYSKILREPKGQLKHKFIVPGSIYRYELWDWDSWLTDIALTQVAAKEGTLKEIKEYQKGCILNFAEHLNTESGRIPIMIGENWYFPNISPDKKTNSIKPVLIQHALFVAETHNDFEWLKPIYHVFQKHIDFYEQNCKHESGLFFFIDDFSIGVDNDPCTFYRPNCSSGSIFLNCLMYKELLAMDMLTQKLGIKDNDYKEKAIELKNAINEQCYDERNGFYYSVDLNLLPINPDEFLHSGYPRNWSTLIQRIDVWSGMLAMWAGIADEKQAKRMVEENYLNTATFNSPYGIRSLSKCEKMYQINKSSNPSCWLGPIWGIANYFTYRALLKYGYTDLADDLADKTINLFGKDIESCGEFHEYYDPETGEGVFNAGFQSWNLLCANIIEQKRTGNSVKEV